VFCGSINGETEELLYSEVAWWDSWWSVRLAIKRLRGATLEHCILQHIRQRKI